MGKKIDRFMLTSILAAALFFYFEAAFQNRPFAILLAVFSCVVVCKLLRRIFRWIGCTSWQQKRDLRRKSSGALIHLACLEDDEALNMISRLLACAYHNDAPIALDVLHPSLQLTREKVFNIWRSHLGDEKLVLCTTGKCTSEVRVFASSLKAPKLAIVDADVLSQLIAEHPELCFPTQSEKKKRLLRMNQFAQLVFNRRNAPRGMLFSFSMLVMYVFSGNLWYLAAALFLLFAALVSLRRVNRPAKLF